METKSNMNARPITTPKKNDNGGLVGGALGAAIGTAFGAIFGVGGAYAYNRLTDNEEDIPEITIEPNTDEEVSIAPEPEPTHTVHHHHHHTDVVVVPTPVNNNGGGGDVINGGGGDVINGGGGGGGGDIRVLSYERVTMDDGSQIDVVTVSMNGQQAAIVDVDLDGWADGILADMNNDGNISEDEIQSFEGTDVQINMSDLAAVAEQNNLDGDPGNGPTGEVVVYDEGDDFDEGFDNGDDVMTPLDDTGLSEDPNLILTSNEGTDGTLPDYCNTGDVSDIVTDSDDMLLV